MVFGACDLEFYYQLLTTNYQLASGQWLITNGSPRRDPSPQGNRETEKQKNRETKTTARINVNIRYSSSGRHRQV